MVAFQTPSDTRGGIEASLLAALIARPGLIPDVFAVVNRSDFALPLHATIAEALAATHGDVGRECPPHGADIAAMAMQLARNLRDLSLRGR